LIEIGITLAIAISFSGGWLAGQMYAAANPPSFELLDNYADEITLLKLESFENNILRGSYEGRQPRFLFGENEELVIPKEEIFELDLGKL
jgi:hypothetical protein